MHQLNEKIVTFTEPNNIEWEAKQQLYNISNMPFLFKHVAVMPDVHLGKGATVGSVIATEGAVIPAAVGVDIGCGMIAVQTKLFAKDLPDSLKDIRDGIERRIPLGPGKFNQKTSATTNTRIKELVDLESTHQESGTYLGLTVKWPSALGTLGGGNHFIELCLDETQRVWVTLHSGSRGIGLKIAMKHIKIAQEIMALHHIKLPDRDLAYLSRGTGEYDLYLRDLAWAQKFALLNREEMMDRVMTELSYSLYGGDGHQKEMEVERINCHHNFSQIENHFGHNVLVTRKGAIQTKLGQMGIIPGSMSTASYIVAGLENRMSFHSAPHGAGRRFSRTEAKRRFTMEDLEKSMQGIECRLRPSLLDEIEGGYKDISQVMEDSRELVEVKHTLKQVLNVKGD